MEAGGGFRTRVKCGTARLVCAANGRLGMKAIKGPALFLAQFAGDEAPFNSLDAICGWAASLGYAGVQIPSWDARLFNLERAAGSKDYCDLVKGTVASHG